MLHEWLMFLHILSVVLYFGGAVAVTIQATGAARIPRQFLTLTERSNRAIGVGAVLTLLTGIALVVESDVFDFSTFFVWFGIAAVVLSGAVDGLYTSRKTAAIKAAIDDEGPDSPIVAAGFRQVIRVSVALLVLLAIVAWAMVFNTGA